MTEKNKTGKSARLKRKLGDPDLEQARAAASRSIKRIPVEMLCLVKMKGN